MADYSYYSTPWENCRDQIRTVIIGDGVTSIGDSAFAWCESLTSVTIPASVTSIRDQAFGYCGQLADVYYSGSESQWGQISFGEGNDELLNAAIHYNS